MWWPLAMFWHGREIVCHVLIFLAIIAFGAASVEVINSVCVCWRVRVIFHGFLTSVHFGNLTKKKIKKRTPMDLFRILGIRTGISLQLRLMRGVLSNANYLKISLLFRTMVNLLQVPVQYRNIRI